jgi:hypothetical protein
VDTVIDSVVESIVVQSNNTDTVVSDALTATISNTNIQNVTTNITSTTNVGTTEIQNVLVEIPVYTVITSGLTGIQGPPGINEEDIVYSKRTDFIGEDVIYKGEAAVGSLTSAASWRIRKLTISPDGDVSETWASGNANFDKIWDNRVSLVYS